MNEEHLARFEANIERLVESAFANFFGRKMRAQEVALQLARAMEDNLRHGSGDPRPLAPDHYTIQLHPQVYAHLAQRQPTLPATLSQHLLMLATQTGYRLNNVPMIEFVTDASLDQAHVEVRAHHSSRPEHSTAALQRVTLPTDEEPRFLKAHLLVNDERVIGLDNDIVNIGRFRDNDIIIDDPYVSRHHLQIRRRHNEHILFDVDSQGGTFVNHVRVKEHRLRSGDVIRLGKTQIVYLLEGETEHEDAGLAQTDALDPVD